MSGTEGLAAKTLDVNYRFFAHFVSQLPNSNQLRILDYGCGTGEVVQLLRDAGLDCYGVETAYEGANFDKLYESDLFKQGIIRIIPESGESPYEDKFFDVIISNQVFEHVRDKEAVFENLLNLLKDDGFMRHHFPTLDVVREGHIGIPFAHWLPKGSFRLWYTTTLRRLGFGYYKQGKSVQVWAKDALDWIDNYCHYEHFRNTRKTLSKHYSITHKEIDYCQFRAKSRAPLAFLLSIRPLKGLYEYMFRRLAFVAIELRKR